VYTVGFHYTEYQDAQSAKHQMFQNLMFTACIQSCTWEQFYLRFVWRKIGFLSDERTWIEGEGCSVLRLWYHVAWWMVTNTLAQPVASIFSRGDRSRRFIQRVHKHVPNYMELHSKHIIAVLILANVTLLAVLYIEVVWEQVLRGIIGYSRETGTERWRRYVSKILYCSAKVGSYYTEKCNVGE
jgi:hypothetical protein